MPEGELNVALTVLRVIRGWTQEDLARASGVRTSSLSEYERGKKIPELKTLQRLVAAMGFPLAALDHTQTFIHALRSEGLLTDRMPFLGKAEWRGKEAGSWEVKSVPAESNDATLQWEVEQVSAEAGRVVTRLTRLLFVLMKQPSPAPDSREP